MGIAKMLYPQIFTKKMLTSGMIYSIIICVAGNAQVAELADAQDLKSCGTFIPCRFDPGLGHHDGASFACSVFAIIKEREAVYEVKRYKFARSVHIAF